MKSFFKLFSFLPALIMMYVIYSFSAQTGTDSGALSRQVAAKIVDVYEYISENHYTEEDKEYYIEKLQYPVRKAAHMGEYFLLAVCISFPCYVYGLRGIWLMLVAGIVCVGFAGLDEYHQSMVAGRGPSLKDVAIDSVGAFLGIIVVRIVCFTFLIPSKIAAAIRDFRDR